MKKLFKWSTKRLESGRAVKIRLDENGVQIPKATWDDFDFEEIGSKLVVPPKPKVNYTSMYENSTLKVMRNGTIIMTAQIGGLPYCCGLREFGNISIIGDRETFPEDIKDNDFKKALDKGVKAMITANTNDENNRCLTMVITLKEDQTFMAESFTRTGDFEQVKEFTNSNTGNLLTLWYSTN